MNRFSFLFVLGLAVAVILGAVTGFLSYKSSTLDDDLKKLDIKASTLQSDVVSYEGANIEEALSAKEAVNHFEDGYVKWSEVIDQIISTTPKDEDTRIPLVDYISYSGSQGNKLTMNVRTDPSSDAPYFDVAKMIRSFSDSEYFRSPFVPSISPIVNDEGKLTLSFNFSVEYVPGGAEAGAQAEASDEDAEADEAENDAEVVEDEEPVKKSAAPSFKPVIK
jgi:hypothetical protein